MKEARIVKLIGGIYTLKTEDNEKIALKPRGLFRHENIDPRVGDVVLFDDDFIQEVKPRQSILKRPSIANVDQAFLISGAKEPEFSFFLLDRFLVHTEHAGIDAIIVINKIDLLSPAALETLKEQFRHYEKYYTIYFVSAKQEATLHDLRAEFKDKVSVFAGQTGSGKSSILNAIDPSLKLKTQMISKALGRGRHTTRHSELIDLFGGLVADTPGFSKLDFESLDATDIKDCYIDFISYAEACKFRGCLHLKEPGCAVKKAVEDHEIPRLRYENYIRIQTEVSQMKKRY